MIHIDILIYTVSFDINNICLTDSIPGHPE